MYIPIKLTYLDLIMQLIQLLNHFQTTKPEKSYCTKHNYSLNLNITDPDKFYKLFSIQQFTLSR